MTNDMRTMTAAAGAVVALLAVASLGAQTQEGFSFRGRAVANLVLPVRLAQEKLLVLEIYQDCVGLEQSFPLDG